MSFYIAPITSGDSVLPSKDEHVRMFSQPSHSGPYGAVHLPSTRTIYLPLDWPISPIWNQLALLHEGSHALDTVTGRRESMTMWQQEVKARCLEGSVLVGLYGRQLSPLLDRLHPQVEKAADDGRLSSFALPDLAAADLVAIFGSPVTRYDLDEQREAVRRLAILHFLRCGRAGPELWRQSVPDGVDTSDRTEPVPAH
jgi:hypothetical protein